VILSAILVCLLLWRHEKVEQAVVKTVEKVQEVRTRGTVQDRLDQYGESARERFLPYFEQAEVNYPPPSLTFIGLKSEKTLQIYADDETGRPRFVREYPILAASGDLGPKLEQGDRQVPEGIYSIEYFNPNSSYHLSMKIDYPNEFDRAMALKEGRSNLGGDIMIHGSSVSIGCLAMGDEAIEEIFTMATETGRTNIRVILAPVDFRNGIRPEEVSLPEGTPSWIPTLYEKIQEALLDLPSPNPSN
ncbi:MAG: L,D-transpeptidase family protein, partial [Candidatus Omnitrophica bacterium]|nr:L,D-transpeptidase family protein [Candidatus Omnitrophota bacterium]